MTRLNHGKFIDSEGKTVIKRWDFFYISARNSLSMESEYSPVGLFTRLLVLIESFLSQILIFGIVLYIIISYLENYKQSTTDDF